MATQIMVRDESMSGKIVNEWTLDLLAERITVRELIRSRVYQEVQDYNRQSGDIFQGLVQPNDSEAALNGYRLRERRQIDWREQFNRAIDAFQANQVLVLVNDRQVAELDETIEITPSSYVSFLRLTMLVGG